MGEVPMFPSFKTPNKNGFSLNSVAPSLESMSGFWSALMRKVFVFLVNHDTHTEARVGQNGRLIRPRVPRCLIRRTYRVQLPHDIFLSLCI